MADHVVVVVTRLEGKAQVAGTVDQRELIRAAGIIDNVISAFFRLLFVRDDSVAQTDGFQELFDLLVVWMVWIFHMGI